MSAADFDLLRPLLRPVDLAFRQIIHAPNETIGRVYFPEAGIGSIIASSADGRRAEVGLYGRDGMSAASLLLGVDRVPHEHVIQVEGSALMIGADDLVEVARGSPSLTSLLLRYAQVAAVQGNYTSLSNGSFNIQERLARWLLMCDDRSDDGLHLTHEFLGIMLSVRRSSVTIALQTLEMAGLVRAKRGHVKVLNRPGLEEVAGDSYGVPEAEYERLIGPLS